MELNRRTVIASAAAAGIAASALGGTAEAAPGAASHGRRPVKEHFGTLADGTKVYRWSLENGGTALKVLSYGGIVQSLEIPDRHGRRANVSLGFDSLDDYVASSPYFGALIGRYGNRIAKGRFTLDGKTYQLSVNDGDNSLHGGAKGFDKRVWDVEPFVSGSDVGLRLHHTSVDGDMGYPGTLRATVTYTLTRGATGSSTTRPPPTRPPSSTSPATSTGTWPARAAAASRTTNCRSPPPGTPPPTRA